MAGWKGLGGAGRLRGERGVRGSMVPSVRVSVLLCC